MRREKTFCSINIEVIFYDNIVFLFLGVGGDGFRLSFINKVLYKFK